LGWSVWGNGSTLIPLGCSKVYHADDIPGKRLAKHTDVTVLVQKYGVKGNSSSNAWRHRKFCYIKTLQVFDVVAKELAEDDGGRSLAGEPCCGCLILAGVSLSLSWKQLWVLPVIRAMPNTPATVGAERAIAPVKLLHLATEVPAIFSGSWGSGMRCWSI